MDAAYHGETAVTIRGRWHIYALAFVIFALGLALCAFLAIRLYSGVLSYAKSYKHVVVPGRTAITLAKPGDYTIFHEYKSVADNIVYSAMPGSISGLSCAMQGPDSGREVPLNPAGENYKYSFGSREGVSIFEFNIVESGRYEIECSFPHDGSAHRKTVLSIGEGFGRELMRTIITTFGIVGEFIISVSITAVIIIFGIIKKRPISSPSHIS